ncbi:MAG TPA: EAL domain-containing protein [Thermoanaerobaculia bacterium]|nr:EAL domain-containing protein [Thermoanaerobaculia bacterium]
MRSFQAKLLYLLVSVLVLLLAVTLIAVHVFGQRTMRKSVTEELRVGVRILERILEGRSRQLADKATVIAADFAFRDTVASADRATIASALANHSERIDADAAFVISLDGLVVADTLEGRYAGRPFPLPSLLREAEARGESAAQVALDDRPHQLVVVPMLAPRRIAWVCMGFAIDERVLDDVAAVTKLDVSLWNASARRPELLSTLPQQARGELLERRRAFDRGRRDADEELEIGSTRYQAIVHPIRTADGSRIQTLLQRSIEEAARPYLLLELQIFALSSLALLAALVVATLFARGVSRPLETLAEGAQRIEHGDYGTPVDVHQNDEIGRLATAFNEMRTGIAEREEQIRYQATHDSLTGLPNRTLFLDRLEQAILKARRTGEIVGMIMMDLDRFKDINDTLGHPFGDELLIEIGRRLTQTLRESDTVARLGGDEFAVTFYVRYGRRAVDVAQRISTALETPFALAGVSVDVDASMGIALYPLHANDAETLMKRADIAMYEAKRDHSAFATYEPGRDEHSLRRLAILSDLRHSIAREELVLHYQPKIDFRLEKVAHAEALVRWRHPVHGLLSPDEFVPLAEQSGNIGAITKWVLRRAITDCGEWNAAGLDLTVAVNLSVLDLFDAELPTYIGGLLSEVGLPPSKLVLEITESAVMKDPAYALRILRDLKTRGMTLAIDDYGTGYSSLAHLKRLPVDELKIDKSFVLNLQASATDDLVIVRSTIELGHNMGLRVIAEGVESEEAWNILRDLGCDMGQGYYVSRPLAVEAFRVWVRESKWGLG